MKTHPPRPPAQNRWHRLLVLAGMMLAVAAGGFFATGKTMKALPPPNRYDAGAAESRIKAAATTAGVPYPFENPVIRIFKKPRRLELWASNKLVKKYKVGLGEAPNEDKVRQGDHRTPVGEFYVCTRNDRSSYHLFLGVSYPNAEDAERGLRDKLIAKGEYNAIMSAMKRRERPPWETGLGGMVGIHGYGSSSDWTWGCIALENFEIEELFVSCPLKTPIFISLE